MFEYYGPQVTQAKEIEMELMMSLRVRSDINKPEHVVNVIMTSGNIMSQLRRVDLPEGSKLPKVKRTAKSGIFIAALEADGERCVVCKDHKYVPIKNSARSVTHLINNTDIKIEGALEWSPFDVVRFLYGI